MYQTDFPHNWLSAQTRSVVIGFPWSVRLCAGHDREPRITAGRIAMPLPFQRGLDGAPGTMY